MTVRWYNVESSRVVHSGNVLPIFEYLKKVEDPKYGARFRVRSYRHDRWGDLYTPSTVLKILKNGHVDIDIWQYAHSLRLVMGKPHFLYPKYLWHVVDIDKHQASSPNEMVQYLRDVKSPLPKQIIQTSANNFHLVYKVPNDMLTKDSKFSLGVSIANMTDKIHHMKKSEIEADMKAAGVDIAYMRQPTVRSAYRLPFSLNTKNVLNPFVCKQWVNFDYLLDNPLKLLGNRRVVNIQKRIINPNLWKIYIKPIEKMLFGYFCKSSKMVRPFARLFANNISLLQKEGLAIPQEKISVEFGVSQMGVSKFLKGLRERGVLDIKKEYQSPKRIEGRRICDGSARVYIASDKLLNIISRNAGIDYDVLLEKYEKKHTFDIFLRDIRYLCIMGYRDEDIIRFIDEKMSQKTGGTKRTKREIKYSIRDWRFKTRVSYSRKPKIPISDLIERL